MKLARQYNRANLLTSLLILVLSGAVYYAVIHYILTDKLDRDLDIEEQEIRAYAAKYHKLPLPGDYKDQKMAYKPITVTSDTARLYDNTIYSQPDGAQAEPGRSLVTTIPAGGIRYRVTVTKSSLEAEDLIRLMFMITLALIALFLISLLIINRFLLSSLWRPFYATLKELKAFGPADDQTLTVQPTEIDEFAELNASVLMMAGRVKNDYRELRNFTDNASHEMMTPLAVIHSKLDILIQTEALSDRQGQIIQDVYLAVNKLSRLSQSLLLLAKIENNLIAETEELDLAELIGQKAGQFSEMLISGEIELEMSIGQQKVYMNKYLADILLNNLFSNAIRHNRKAGKISVLLHADTLVISNTGSPDPLDGQKIFGRFYKHSSSEGSGLGMAISSQICKLYHSPIAYKFDKGMHCFSIVFGGKS